MARSFRVPYLRCMNSIYRTSGIEMALRFISAPSKLFRGGKVRVLNCMYMIAKYMLSHLVLKTGSGKNTFHWMTSCLVMFGGFYLPSEIDMSASLSFVDVAYENMELPASYDYTNILFVDPFYWPR